MASRSKSWNLCNWVGLVVCVLVAVAWAASSRWAVAYYGSGWFCVLEDGEMMYSQSNPWGVAGLQYARSAGGWNLSMPRIGSIAPMTPIGPGTSAPLYVLPLWLVFLLLGIPTTLSWCLVFWARRRGEGLLKLAAQHGYWLPLILWLGLAGLILGIGRAFGFSDRDSLIAWCFVVLVTAVACLTARRRQMYAAIIVSLGLAATYYVAGEMLYDWKPGCSSSPMLGDYGDPIESARRLAAGTIGTSGLIAYGLTRAISVALTNWRKRLLARTGRCLECAYDLTGNVSGRCPECGTAVPAKT